MAGAEAIGYCGLATFEFLRNSNGQFYFMEVNPRVQVEHTVTEMLTGVDLVSLGIIVSSGVICLWNRTMFKSTAMQFRHVSMPRTHSLWNHHLGRFGTPLARRPGIRVDTHGFLDMRCRKHLIRC